MAFGDVTNQQQDPQGATLQSNLQEWGLSGIDPALFNAYLQQYMKDTQGLGNDPNAALQALEAYMQSQAQQQQQSSGSPTNPMADEAFQGAGGVQKIANAADQIFGRQSQPQQPTMGTTQTTSDQLNSQPVDQSQQQQDTSQMGLPPSLAAPSLGVNTALQAPPGIPAAPPTMGALTLGGETSIRPVGMSATDLNFTDPRTASLGTGLTENVSPAANLGGSLGPNPFIDPSMDTSGLGPAGVTPAAPGGLSTLGGIGAGLGLLGGGYGLYGGIEGLGKDSPLTSAEKLGGGAFSLYGGAAPVVNAITGAETLPGYGSLATTAGNYAGSLFGNPTLGTDIAGGVSNLFGGGAAAGGEAAAQTAATAAGEEAASAGLAAGDTAAALGADAAATVGGSIGTAGVTLPLALFSLIGSLTGQGWGNFSDLFNPSGEYKGMSKMRGLYETEATDLFKAAQDQMKSATSNYDKGFSDPTGARNAGDQLMEAETNYYMPYEGTGQGGKAGLMDPWVGMGPSSYNYGTGNNPMGVINMQPYNTGMSEWLGLNQYLKSIGQSGLSVSPDMVSATGITQPTNQSSYAMEGADFVPQYGPMGAPPSSDSPGYADWINNAFTAYEHAGGMNVTPASPILGTSNAGTVPTSGPLGGVNTGGGIASTERSGGGSDPEKNQPGAAEATTQASLGTAPNPWAQQPTSATVMPLGSLNDLIAKAQAFGSGQS